MTESNPVALIVGAGSGLGKSLCSTFARGGHRVVGINRSAVPDAAPETTQLTLDATDALAMQSAIADIIEQFGPPHVVIHNTAELLIQPFIDTCSRPLTVT